jgi:hypothetical protein
MYLAKWPGIRVFELKSEAICILCALGACLLGVCAAGTTPSGHKVTFSYAPVGWLRKSDVS